MRMWKLYAASVVVTDDKENSRNLIRAGFAPYYATPVYNKFLAWCGYDDVAESIREGWAAKDREKTTGALNDKLVEDIAILGSEAECHGRIKSMQRWALLYIISCVSPKDSQRTFQAFSGSEFSF